MKTERRVLVVARHYWPSTSDRTLRLRAWVKQLHQQGYQPTIATPRWHTSWPSRIVCDDIAVERLDAPPTSELRSSRYGRELAAWVAHQLQHIDFIYCDAADGDAYALVTQRPKNIRTPIVVRFDPRELQTAANSPRIGAWRPSPKTMEACRRATAVVVPSSFAHQQLLSAGCEPSIIHRVPDAVGRKLDRSPAARTAARMILANINHDLFVRTQDKVLVCPGELTRQWGIDLLINALAPLLEEQRSLKLWILGDSLERGRIHEALQFHGLHRIVVMPGAFTDVDQVLQAADMCIFPAAGVGLGWLLPTCIASSIPVLLADAPELRAELGTLADQLCFRGNDPRDLEARVRRWIRNPKAAEPTVAAARESLVNQADQGSAARTLDTLLRARVLQTG